MSSGLSYKLNKLMDSDDAGKNNFRSTQKIGSNNTIASVGSNKKMGSLAKIRDNKFDWLFLKLLIIFIYFSFIYQAYASKY